MATPSAAGWHAAAQPQLRAAAHLTSATLSPQHGLGVRPASHAQLTHGAAAAAATAAAAALAVGAATPGSLRPQQPLQPRLQVRLDGRRGHQLPFCLSRLLWAQFPDRVCHTLPCRLLLSAGYQVTLAAYASRIKKYVNRWRLLRAASCTAELSTSSAGAGAPPAHCWGGCSHTAPGQQQCCGGTRRRQRRQRRQRRGGSAAGGGSSPEGGRVLS